jgi:NAD(P)-dependent dehydrogenase (short-subunit alcohol dehydrogenase family)
MSFAGRVYTVTGAAGGIGRSTALILAENGATVFAADIKTAELEETVKLGAFEVVAAN